MVATDRNFYALTLKGARLLDVGGVALKQPLATAEISVDKSVIEFDGHRLNVMQNWGAHVERLREVVDSRREIRT